MSNRFAAGKKAIAECDRCSFRFPLKKLKKLTIKGKIVSLKVCPSCWEEDHPQLHLGEVPVEDPQAIREPRPDFSGYAQSRAVILPVFGMAATGFVGNASTNR